METGGKNPHKAQVTQISAVVLEPRKLEVIEGAVFNSEVCPIFDDDKAKELGLDPVSQEALDITHKTRDQLSKSPPINIVWKDFVSFVTRYKKAGDKSNWGNPIASGFNISNYDNIIIHRLCREYGPYDEVYGAQKVFHPLYTFDLMHDIWRWTDNAKISDNNSKSLDAIRDWLGITRDGAHDALVDVTDCVEIGRRFLLKYRDFYTKTKFKGALASWKRPDLKGK